MDHVVHLDGSEIVVPCPCPHGHQFAGVSLFIAILRKEGSREEFRRVATALPPSGGIPEHLLFLVDNECERGKIVLEEDRRVSDMQQVSREGGSAAKCDVRRIL